MKILALVLVVLLLIPTLNFSNAEKIPPWVKNIFIWYGQGQISENELISALQYLIENGIIEVSTTSETIEDKGDLVVYYEPSDDYNDLIQWLQESEDLTVNTGGLNEAFILPYDIVVAFDECGAKNAFYDPQNQEIVMCYELVESFINLFDQVAQNEEELQIRVQDALYFVFLHELGHALVDVYDLPITGKEEDAVDQLSAIMLLEEGEEGINALDSVTVWFVYEGVLDSLSGNLSFWDTHSLNLQRFYNILCLVHGSNPDEFDYLITEEYLPEDRAVYCPDEYVKVSNSWNVLLYDFIKE